MVSKDDIGKPVRYWKNGFHFGLLKGVDKKTAEITHPVLKRVQKVHVEDCEVYIGGQYRMPTVYESLLKAAQTVNFGKQRIDQSDDEYLTALVRAVSTVDDDTWAKIPLDAQQWYDKAATNINKRDEQIPPRHENPLPGFVGKDEIKETKATTTPPKGLTATELLSGSRASRFQASTPNPTPTPKERGKKGKGYMDAVRRTVLIHPEWTSRQVYDHLKLNGYPDVKLDTISVDGGNVRRVIELAKEMGYWKSEEKAAEQSTQVVA